jgi:hypothetical protein
MAALRATHALYTSLADPLIKQHGIESATDARATVGAALDAGLAWRPVTE